MDFSADAMNPLLYETGTRYGVWHPASPDEMFAPGAFDRSVGKVTAVTAEGRTIGHDRLISAEVAEDGSGAMLTFEVVDRTGGAS